MYRSRVVTRTDLGGEYNENSTERWNLSPEIREILNCSKGASKEGVGAENTCDGIKMANVGLEEDGKHLDGMKKASRGEEARKMLRRSQGEAIQKDKESKEPLGHTQGANHGGEEARKRFTNTTGTNPEGEDANRVTDRTQWRGQGRNREILTGGAQTENVENWFRERRESPRKDDNNSRRLTRTSVPQPLGFGRLKVWSETENPGSLVLFMTSEIKQLETFLNQVTINEGLFILLLKSVNHAITAQHQKESVKQLLQCLHSSRFFDHVAAYMLTDLNREKDIVFKAVTNIVEEMLNKLPHSALKCFTVITQLSSIAHTDEAMQSRKDLVEVLNTLSQRCREIYILEKGTGKKSGRGNIFTSDDSKDPPDNFMDLPIVPTLSDLQENANPFLRCSKVTGGYDDTHHYLDVQFRLLRQDFVFPLRKGIVEFKKGGCKKNFNSSDLRFYYDVRIVGIMVTDGIDHVLQFDVSKLKRVRWDVSKRLIFGSLLCLSKDNFETVLFATVARGDRKDLASGKVNVTFKSGLGAVFNSSSNDVYIMAESVAYFKSCCHVLEGLQEMSSNLPLENYIVKCKKELKPPSYLLPSGGVVSLPIYDLSSLLRGDLPGKYPVLTTVKWPKAEDMCLNESQREAAQMALTREIAIIQGPPGTGKTYVGLKVMQVLMENKPVMGGNDDKSHDPILVVCFTNHALDQFLEGMLEFCPKGIVRVGGKSKSTKLDEFNLKTIKKTLSFSDRSVKKSRFECFQELRQISKKVQDLNEHMSSLEYEVLSESQIENCMKTSHLKSLQSGDPKTRMVGMKAWLGASNDSPQSTIQRMIHTKLSLLILNWDKPVSNISLLGYVGIAHRASFYHYHLTDFKEMIEEVRTELRKQKSDLDIQSQLQELDAWKELTEIGILPDEFIEALLPDNALEQMSRSCQSESESLPLGKILEYWLLGLHRSLHEQLDDIEVLGEVKTEQKKQKSTDDLVFDDDEDTRDEEDNRINEDDDGWEDRNGAYEQKVKTMNENLVSVMERAEMMGITEDILKDEDERQKEWTKVDRTKRLGLNKIRNKLLNLQPMTENEADMVDNVWELSMDQRFALYKFWMDKYREQLTEESNTLVTQYTELSEKKKQIAMEEDLHVLRKATVIGMTTTGAAMHREVLQAVGCRIVVVEEAAEVLESHIVTSLNKQCKHLILIGDHQQLRPSTTVYELAKYFNLEISLFERLIKNKVPHVVLREQHRMRPEIAKIMRHIYPELSDHPSVFGYEDVRGVAHNIFFIQHSHHESHVDDTHSKANTYEAKYIVGLCQYLLNQGYEPSQITILATYVGQVLAIKKAIKDEGVEHRVRVTAVDNFQGEENDIILLSLVRSNDENSVGFLKVDNRVCVALSRAKKGLYAIGNFELLESQSKLWRKITKTLRTDGFIGEGLPVACQNHPETAKLISSYEDFQDCPEGGCGRPCQYQLPCGHVCAKKCHGYDMEHTEYRCHKPCPMRCENGHPCPLYCFQDCGLCKAPVTKTIPECGHDNQVPCYLSPEVAVCSHRCPEILDCDHQCPGTCGQCRGRLHETCTVLVSYIWPCEHINTVPCYKNPTEYPCQTCERHCGDTLDCGHKCLGKWTDCLHGAVHVACNQTCGSVLPCGHPCSNLCGAPCMSCTANCIQADGNEQLQNEDQVSSQDIAKLNLSQSKLSDNRLLADFHSVTMTNIATKTEMNAASFQLKCAYVLSEISALKNLDILYDSSSIQQLLTSRKDAVLNIGRRLTDQQKHEWTVELLRCFWLAFFPHMKELCSIFDISVPENIKRRMNKILKLLRVLKPPKDTMDEAENVASIYGDHIRELALTSAGQESCLKMSESSSGVLKVLQSKEDQMLWDVLGGGSEEEVAIALMRYPPPRTPDSRPGLISSSSDENETSTPDENPAVITHPTEDDNVVIQREEGATNTIPGSSEDSSLHSDAMSAKSDENSAETKHQHAGERSSDSGPRTEEKVEVEAVTGSGSKVNSERQSHSKKRSSRHSKAKSKFLDLLQRKSKKRLLSSMGEENTITESDQQPGTQSSRDWSSIKRAAPSGPTRTLSSERHRTRYLSQERPSFNDWEQQRMQSQTRTSTGPPRREPLLPTPTDQPQRNLGDSLIRTSSRPSLRNVSFISASGSDVDGSPEKVSSNPHGRDSKTITKMKRDPLSVPSSRRFSDDLPRRLPSTGPPGDVSSHLLAQVLSKPPGQAPSHLPAQISTNSPRRLFSDPSERVASTSPRGLKSDPPSSRASDKPPSVVSVPRVETSSISSGKITTKTNLQQRREERLQNLMGRSRETQLDTVGKDSNVQQESLNEEQI